MSDLPWFNVDGGIQRLREIGRLLTNTGKGLEDTLLPKLWEINLWEAKFEAKWQHSNTKGKVGVVIIMNLKVKAVIKLDGLMQAYGIDWLIMAFLEGK